ncbi:PTS IIA-like nitrogen regulatory protein PtsN [Halioxenophilus sp. WMMB6]|uniref:PTS IIA-like nitrogen regulatory protein PtsN n=1 Tax=Halioxenophilus sp. WMMB6 TaxID=3073815 RepID=UPI00295EE6A5|nr:PTS IIA-like nitrogen regulatory protein PtsN [Halioxenophilus sp. WMMB6]
MTIKLSSILAPSRVVCGLEGISKKRTLETIAKLIAEDIPVLDAEELFRRLMARERLGSTGIGHGIAIPHCRLENCAGTMGAFFKLSDKVDFDAIDDTPVDAIFALLVPEEADDTHLQTLATIARTFSDADLLSKIRQCQSSEELYQTLIAVD